MKSIQSMRTGRIVSVVVLLLALAFGAQMIFGGKISGYEHAEKYTAGETDISGTVRNLEIDWLNGKVTLKYHSGNALELRETSLKTISGDMQMRWWLDGDTLRVKYAKSGYQPVPDQEKELTVSVPEGCTFQNVTVHSTSGDLDMNGIRADNLKLGSTSGDILALAEAGNIEASATSGNVLVQTEEETGAVSVSSTSGTIQISAGHVKACDVTSTSGNVSIDIRKADRVKAGSTSGTVSVALTEFASLDASTTSGGITATLSGQPGFTAEIHTLNGKIDCDTALSREGSRYVCGDGSAKADFSTTSGNIRLMRAGQ